MLMLKLFVVDWEARCRRLVAEFRADCRSRLEEPELQSLVAELSKSSTEFDQFWKQHDVLERQGGLTRVQSCRIRNFKLCTSDYADQ